MKSRGQTRTFSRQPGIGRTATGTLRLVLLALILAAVSGLPAHAGPIHKEVGPPDGETVLGAQSRPAPYRRGGPRQSAIAGQAMTEFLIRGSRLAGDGPTGFFGDRTSLGRDLAPGGLALGASENDTVLGADRLADEATRDVLQLRDSMNSLGNAAEISLWRDSSPLKSRRQALLEAIYSIDDPTLRAAVRSITRPGVDERGRISFSPFGLRSFDLLNQITATGKLRTGGGQAQNGAPARPENPRPGRDELANGTGDSSGAIIALFGLAVAVVNTLMNPAILVPLVIAAVLWGFYKLKRRGKRRRRRRKSLFKPPGVTARASRGDRSRKPRVSKRNTRRRKFNIHHGQKRTPR